MEELSLREFMKETGNKIFGTNEFALSNNDALIAIELAKKENLPILGGDVYFSRDGKIEPAYANWHTDKLDKEESSVYLAKTWKNSKDYIERFVVPKDVEVLYVLIVPIIMK